MAIESNALIIGWNRAVVGREAVAGELFAKTSAYYDKLQKSGKITSWEPMFLQQHGGDLNGFFVLKGTSANLDAIRSEEEFVDLILRAGHCLTNVGVIPAYSGMNTIMDMMTRWTKAIPR
jgi:hypothetical protein